MAETSPGSKKWPTSVWRDLLREAIALLDALPQPPIWTFGGGTALAVHYGHRVSHDIDVFVPSSDIIASLSPARNSATKTLLGGRRYEYPGHYLKLYLDGGEIDFLVGSRRSSDPVRPWNFEGREIAIETPWESAIKKIFHRPSQFKVRDVFDLAAVIEHHSDQLRSALPEVEDRLDKLVDRIERLAPSYANLTVNDINPTESGRKYMEASAILSVLAFLKDWRNELEPANRT
jgi:hypothetical protein